MISHKNLRGYQISTIIRKIQGNRTDREKLANLLEALDGLSDTPTNFRQLLGTEDQRDDSGDDGKLGNAETE